MTDILLHANDTRHQERPAVLLPCQGVPAPFQGKRRYASVGRDEPQAKGGTPRRPHYYLACRIVTILPVLHVIVSVHLVLT